MSTQRIMMPKGHQALCLEGHNYLPDDSGAFVVPLKYVPELIRVHGAQTAPSAEDHLRRAADLEARARVAQQQADGLKAEAEAARTAATAETERVRKLAEERAQAEAAAAAKEKADAEARAKADAEAKKKAGAAK